MRQFYIYILLIGIFDLVGTITAKLWSVNKSVTFLIITIVCFALSGLFIAMSMKYGEMAIVNIMWVAVSTLFVTLFGYFVFKEYLTPLQIIGILAVVVGFILVNFKK